MQIPVGKIDKQNHVLSDKIGIASSAACLLHCLAAPIVVALITGGEFANRHHHFDLFALILDIVFLVLAFWASNRSARKASSNIKFILYLGIALFTLGISLRYTVDNDLLIHIGSIVLILGHLIHFRNSTKATCHI
jgi:hypothetical protein